MPDPTDPADLTTREEIVSRLSARMQIKGKVLTNPQMKLGSAGELDLDALRPAAARVSRLAGALFRRTDFPNEWLEADVVVVQQAGVWKAQGDAPELDDAAGAEFVMSTGEVAWVEDLHRHPFWGARSQVASGKVRFYAGAPIQLSGGHRLGVLRVFGDHARAYDAGLSERLSDLAGIVADECERLLGAEARRLRELFALAPGFMALARGPDHVFEMANPAYLRFVQRDDVIGRTVREALPEIADQGFVSLLDEVYRTGVPHRGRDVPISVSPEGQEQPVQRFMDFVYQPLRDANGEVHAIFCEGVDVTAAHNAKVELTDSREQLRRALRSLQSILDNSLDVICTFDEDGNFVQVSQRAAQVLGYSPEELVGRPFDEMTSEQDRVSTRAMWSHLRAGASTSSFLNHYVHPDGSTVPVMWSAVWSEADREVIAIARDMREREATEAQLRHAQKMEAVGQLTGGIAHDFNNLLTVILGNAELLADPHSQPELTPTLAAEIMRAASRGANLVERLLAFGRRQPLKTRPTVLRNVVEDMKALLATAVGEQIEVRTEHGEHQAPVLTDHTELESAVLNLAVNARDAMPDGGTLFIRTGFEEAAGDEGPLASGQSYAYLSVEDTGVGIAPDVIDRVFEPFFTTKDVGAGTGLGLAMVYGFVEQIGGRVTIQSAVGQGTRVTLAFQPIAA